MYSNRRGARPWMVGIKQSPETIRRRVEKNTGKKRSEEAKKRISESNKGKHFYSEEVLEKIRKGNTGKKQSKETRMKKSIANSGRNNPNYRDGRTPENHRIRHGIEMKLWRDSVFARDGYTCQKYKIRGGTLRAHHINNFADFPGLRTSIENGITLSEKAHREFHKKFGRRNNTVEQLLEFLQGDSL